MDWPSWFPGACPPETARAPSAPIYRITKESPPAATDFVASCKEKPDLYDCNNCSSCGVSVYDTPEEARVTMKRYPRIGRYIAKGSLASAHGMVEKTRANGHHDWWVPAGVDPSPAFHVLAGGPP